MSAINLSERVAVAVVIAAAGCTNLSMQRRIEKPAGV
jgi:hypothetical protein